MRLDHPFVRRAAPLALAALAACHDSSSTPTTAPTPVPLTITPSAGVVLEHTVAEVALAAVGIGKPTSYTWRQTAGPKVPLLVDGAKKARAQLGGLDVAADAVLAFELEVVGPKGTFTAESSFLVRSTGAASLLGERVQLGGSTLAVTAFGAASDPLDGSLPGATHAVHGVGGCLEVWSLADPLGERGRAFLTGGIRDVEVAWYGTTPYAIVALGTDGIGVVDLGDPLAPTLVAEVPVGYEQGGLSWCDGGGNIALDQTLASTRGTVVSLLASGTNLWIADADYGVHRTSLDNLLGATGPLLEADGTLVVDAEVCTLHLAGERPWGGAHGLLLHDNRLFVALAELGLGIFDPATLEQVGGYNLYLDVGFEEDWFGALDVASVAQPGGLDPATGMPNEVQTQFEILEVGQGGLDAPTPWADFEGYGRFYYSAVGLALAEWSERDIVYLASGLGGCIAVDVTGAHSATPGSPLAGQRVSFLPAVPDHGPESPTGKAVAGDGSLIEHSGLGRLKEAGVRAVGVEGEFLLLTDHFGGLIVAEGAEPPELGWHGPFAPYQNDTDGIAGNHVPAFENVTSFDMSKVSEEDEALPVWLVESPVLAATGEVAGHASAFLTLSTADLALQGTLDVLLASGAGGLALLDGVGFGPAPGDPLAPALGLQGLLPVAILATTDELGAAPDGTPTAAISVGHAEGLATDGSHLFVADGPHGVSAWRLVDGEGFPTADPHVVANTLQSESAVEVGGQTLLPVPHAHTVLYDAPGETVYTACKSVGLRLLDVAGVSSGLAQPGAPLLLVPTPQDVYEHKVEEDEGEAPALPKQDQANDVALHDHFAFVADGPSGLVVYDLLADPTDPEAEIVVGNVGGALGETPSLGVANAVALWTDQGDDRLYAIVAAGPRGIGVVDATDPSDPFLVKVFEPIKIEEEEGEETKVSAADGRAVDVVVVGDVAHVTYDSFGVLAYSLADLVAPLPEGVDPQELWKFQGGALLFDHRPVALGHFQLAAVPGYEDVDGGAFGLAVETHLGQTRAYVAYDDAGLVVLDWSDPAAPQLVTRLTTAGECTAVAVGDGGVFVADGSGGIALFR